MSRIFDVFAKNALTPRGSLVQFDITGGDNAGYAILRVYLYSYTLEKYAQ